MRTLLVALLMVVPAAHAQFELQDSGVTVELRGIDNVGGGVAWASGSDGVVLRTVDGGSHWERCAVPGDGDGRLLDFRGVQGMDAKTAVVMASGAGSLSRLYKTTDGCRSWRLVLANTDKDGCFDVLKMNLPLISMTKEKVYQGRVFGDPVRGQFVEFDTEDGGDHWVSGGDAAYPMPLALPGERPLAASNSSALYFANASDLLVTGGVIGSHSHVLTETIRGGRHSMKYMGGDLPLASYFDNAGAASVAIASTGGGAPHIAPEDKERVLYVDSGVLVAVGGDEKKWWAEKGTAAYSVDAGVSWKAATTMPRGYRSAVAYDAAAKMWIAVGPNGTDVSTDDGVNWRAVGGDEDKGWNAISLPFVVGSKGRIGLVRAGMR